MYQNLQYFDAGNTEPLGPTRKCCKSIFVIFGLNLDFPRELNMDQNDDVYVNR